MSIPALTLETAPRDFETLRTQPPYQLKMLAERLGLLSEDSSRMAWHELKTNDSKAEYLYKYLQAWDAQRGGAPPQATAPVADARTPVNGTNGAAAHVPSVTPLAYTQAAAAAAATAAPQETRTPRNTGVKKVIELPSTSAPSVSTELLTVVAKLLEAQGAIAEKVSSLDTNFKALMASVLPSGLGAISAEVADAKRVAVWALMALVSQLENTTGASAADILRMAIQDAELFPKQVEQASKGKAG